MSGDMLIGFSHDSTWQADKLTCRVTHNLGKYNVLRYTQFDNCNEQPSVNCLGLQIWYTSLAGNGYSRISNPSLVHSDWSRYPTISYLVITSQGVEFCCRCSRGEPFWSQKLVAETTFFLVHYALNWLGCRWFSTEEQYHDFVSILFFCITCFARQGKAKCTWFFSLSQYTNFWINNFFLTPSILESMNEWTASAYPTGVLVYWCYKLGSGLWIFCQSERANSCSQDSCSRERALTNQYLHQ